MLKVYGHPASQPSRAVIWACVMNGLPIELRPDIDSISNINPRGQMPAIDDEGFVLSEMAAILTYLAEKHGWHSLYPKNLQTRARIDQYLHAHHSMTRLATIKLMAPHVLVAFGGNPSSNPISYINNTCIEEAMANPNRLSEGQVLVGQVVDLIERQYLNGCDFIAATDHVSIADLACYEELGQLKTAGLMNFDDRPNVIRWMARMQTLPHHDALHRYNDSLGDIMTSPNTMERFVAAIKASFVEMQELDAIHLAEPDL